MLSSAVRPDRKSCMALNVWTRLTLIPGSVFITYTKAFCFLCVCSPFLPLLCPFCLPFRKVNKCYRGRSCPIIVHCKYVQMKDIKIKSKADFCERPEFKHWGKTLYVCVSLRQWWHWQDWHVHPYWHGAEPYGKGWDTHTHFCYFWVNISTCT